MLKKRLVLSRSVVVGNILADVNLNEYADTLPHNQTWWLYYFMLRLDEARTRFCMDVPIKKKLIKNIIGSDKIWSGGLLY